MVHPCGLPNLLRLFGKAVVIAPHSHIPRMDHDDLIPSLVASNLSTSEWICILYIWFSTKNVNFCISIGTLIWMNWRMVWHMVLKHGLLENIPFSSMIFPAFDYQRVSTLRGLRGLYPGLGRSVRLDVWLVGHELANGKKFAALTYIWLKPPVYRHLFLTSSLWLVWNSCLVSSMCLSAMINHVTALILALSITIPAWSSQLYDGIIAIHIAIHPEIIPSTAILRSRFPLDRCHQEGLAVQPPDVSLAGTTRATWLFFFALTWPWHQKVG